MTKTNSCTIPLLKVIINNVTTYCYLPSDFPAICLFDLLILRPNKTPPFLSPVQRIHPAFPNRLTNPPIDLEYRPTTITLFGGTCANNNVKQNILYSKELKTCKFHKKNVRKSIFITIPSNPEYETCN